MAISMRFPIRPALPIVAIAALTLAGCEMGEKAVNGFAGGSNSKDKQPIPASVDPNAAAVASPPVQANAAGTPLSTPDATSPTAVAGPAVVSKGEVEVSESGPLRTTVNKYRAGQSRDPFASLIGTDVRSDLVDLSVVRLVGVVTSGGRPFAIVEDADGVSYVLRKGDRIKNGRVVRVEPTALVCSQTMLGYTTTVQLKLEHGKDVKNG